MTRGHFISFEGGEGSGKSTQARLLALHLAGRGHSVELTREPGGTEGAEAIRSLLLDPPGEGWGARAEAMLFAAARSDHVERRINPALDAGSWVIADRFLDSSRAYQGGAGGLGDEAICQLHRIGSTGLLPIRTVLIDIAPEIAAERVAARDGGSADAIGGRSAEYHAGVGIAFRQLAANEPERFRIIDGNGEVETVHQLVLDALSDLIGASR